MAANVDFASPSALRRLLRQLRIYAGIIYRVDWLAMFIFARFEIVQKYAGRKRNPSSPSPQAAVERSMLQTELPVQEIVRRISADGIADGLRLSEDNVAQVISFAARAPMLWKCGASSPARSLSARMFGNAGGRCSWRLPRRHRRLRSHPAAVAGAKDVGDSWRLLGHSTAPFEVAAIGRTSGPAAPPLRCLPSIRRIVFTLISTTGAPSNSSYYMTDVCPENGPHIYVRKSHRNQPMLDQLSPFKSRSSSTIS